MDKGVIAHSGNRVDASIVEVPKQRNSREENEQIQEGKEPEGWSEPRRRQKDVDARWVTKGGVGSTDIRILYRELKPGSLTTTKSNGM